MSKYIDASSTLFAQLECIHKAKIPEGHKPRMLLPSIGNDSLLHAYISAVILQAGLRAESVTPGQFVVLVFRG